MPAITATITVRLPERLLERVDEAAAAGAVSRNAWLVATLYSCLESGAVERALDGLALGKGGEHESATASPPPASAEQPETWREALADRSAGANPVRPFSPYPKGGKR